MKFQNKLRKVAKQSEEIAEQCTECGSEMLEINDDLFRCSNKKCGNELSYDEMEALTVKIMDEKIQKALNGISRRR